jgi:hypothetical protein
LEVDLFKVCTAKVGIAQIKFLKFRFIFHIAACKNGEDRLDVRWGLPAFAIFTLL